MSELVDDGVVDGPTVTVVMIGSTVFATPTPATRDTQQCVDSGRRYRRRSAGSPDPTAHNTLTGVTVPSQVHVHVTANKQSNRIESYHKIEWSE